MARLRFDHDQMRYGLSHVALRLVLGGYVGVEPHRIELEHDRLGKPHVVGSDVRWSLAHAGGYALIAVGRHQPLGVDLEPVRDLPDAAQLTRSCFTPSERAHLGTTATTEELLRLWTRKEAVLKATGEGLRRRLDELDVLEETGLHGYRIVDVVPAPGYVGAAAVRHDLARLVKETFGW
jgi:4'-phosphopantetheinyl transferase